MRYYRIEIEGGPTFSSVSGGVNLRGALLVELDIPVAPMATPIGSAYVKVWGVSNETVSQAKDFSRKNVKVFGGMQRGLPLANPTQAGLLVQGWIFQSFGNWLGKDQSLDLYIVPGVAPGTDKPVTAPTYLTLDWKKGTPLAEALRSTLQTAFSGFQLNINLDPNLVATEDTPGFFGSLGELGRYVKDTSRSIIGGTAYPGADILLTEKTFNIYDGTKKPRTKLISFRDLIGQPTWIAAPQIQFKCPMRADLSVGDAVTLPKTLVTNSAQAQSSLINQRAAFQGDFQIASVHHYGSSRQPDAYSWATTFNAFPLQSQAAAQ